jgi:hypothetical protein
MVDAVHEEAFAARGITASAAVVAREGLPDGLKYPDRAVGRLLGEDGLGKAFDALVASGNVDHVDLLATAVERSHEYYGVPAVLASGEARRWAHDLSDQQAWSLRYDEAPVAFEQAQAQAVVASARESLRKRVHGD